MITLSATLLSFRRVNYVTHMAYCNRVDSCEFYGVAELMPLTYFSNDIFDLSNIKLSRAERIVYDLVMMVEIFH